MKFLWFCLLSCLGLVRVFAFNNDHTHVLVEGLLKDRKAVPQISWSKNPYFSSLDPAFATFPQNLIKSGSDVYVFINGSGRLYKSSMSDTGMTISRVDSTVNFGYNIGSFGFSYNNHIYNLGGYGIWRMNGQLRIFNEKAKQWDIVKLNQEIPILTGITEGLLWYDIKEGKIYTAYYLLRNEALKTNDLDETRYIYDVMVLDLDKSEWTRLGSLNSFLKDKLTLVKPIAMSPWGQLISIGDKINLLDFKTNKILSLDSRKNYYQTLSRSFWGSSFYFEDSTLFYGNQTSIDSVEMHYTDFIPNNQTLYTTDSPFISSSAKYFYIFLFLAIVSTATFFRIKMKRETSTTEVKTLTPKDKLKNTNDIFESLEIQLLQLLINNTSAGNITTIDEQNEILGLTKKNPEIQKKHRSDIIIAINRKYSLVSNSDEPLIQKRRNEIDKRSYDYFIDHLRLDEIKTFLATKG